VGRDRGPDENGGGDAFGLTNHVEQPVDAIAEINVGGSRRAVERGVSRSLPGEGMATGLALMVRLDFHDLGLQLALPQSATEEGDSPLVDITS